MKFEADSVSGGEMFLGNLDPGATGNVDAYIVGEAATADDGAVKILISYEDEEGKQSVIEENMTVFVSEPYYEEMFFEDPMMEGMEEEKSGIAGWIIGIVAVLAAAGGVAVVLIMKKKKGVKRQEQEELEMIELLDDEESEEMGE